jgi:hypothetical protein
VGYKFLNLIVIIVYKFSIFTVCFEWSVWMFL